MPCLRVPREIHTLAPCSRGLQRGGYTPFLTALLLLRKTRSPAGMSVLSPAGTFGLHPCDEMRYKQGVNVWPGPHKLHEKTMCKTFSSSSFALQGEQIPLWRHLLFHCHLPSTLQPVRDSGKKHQHRAETMGSREPWEEHFGWGFFLSSCVCVYAASLLPAPSQPLCCALLQWMSCHWNDLLGLEQHFFWFQSGAKVVDVFSLLYIVINWKLCPPVKYSSANKTLILATLFLTPAHTPQKAMLFGLFC